MPDVELRPLGEYVEVTDAGILREICKSFDDEEFQRIEASVRGEFLQRLRRAVHTRPEDFRAVAGAQSIFHHVRQAGWTPTIATGGWRESAELKLAIAEIPMHQIPLVTSSEEAKRVDIIRLAVREAAPMEVADDVVYIGDGTWDVRACRELGIGFVGRADPDREGLLRNRGAQAVIADFTEPASLLETLNKTTELRPHEG